MLQLGRRGTGVNIPTGSSWELFLDCVCVSHPSTNQARPCLASEIRRDRARSGWYGRRLCVSHALGSRGSASAPLEVLALSWGLCGPGQNPHLLSLFAAQSSGIVAVHWGGHNP